MKNERLKKHLGGVDVFAVTSGAMISSGLFILPGLIYAKVGPAVIIVYIIAGFFALPALFSKIELTTAMPKAGGSYFFIERSMGSFAGLVGGLSSWFSLSFKSAFALIGIGEFVVLLYPDISTFHVKLIAMAFCVLFTLINMISVKHTGKTQVLLVLVLISLLIFYVLSGSFMIKMERYTPFFVAGKDTLFLGVGMVFISFGGLTKASSIAEEVKNLKKNIPLGMIAAFIAVIILYELTIFVTVGLLNNNELSHSLIPLSLGGGKIFGNPGVIIMAVAAILAFISTANAGILSASRYPVAMSRDQLLPSIFSKLNKKYFTPHYSILATGIFMVLIILFLDLENLVKIASAMKMTLFIFVLLAHIVMRESKILNYKPSFISPMYPWFQIMGIISYTFFLYEMGWISLAAFGAAIIISLIWYKLYIQKANIRKSALIHIVERVTAKEIAGDSLGDELRSIIRNRDIVREDRFDKLLKKCEIIDLDNQLELEDFFKVISEKLSEKMNVTSGELFEKFTKREEEGTTALRSGLAIPHVIVNGEKKFELIIVRCESGINFSEDQPPVYVAFVLAGSADERSFHLHSLSAIAQITQNENFNRDWLRAKSINQLRDIVMLSTRKR